MPVFLSQGRDVHIEPIDGAPMAINGKPITSATLIENGDWLALGSAFVRIAIAAATPGPQPMDIAAGFSEGRVIRIGRLETGDLVIPSPLVSRYHANIRCAGGRVYSRISTAPMGLLSTDNGCWGRLL